MANTTWNTSIPLNWVPESYREVAGNKVLRTKVDDGPDKIRLLGTGSQKTIEGRITLTSAQADALMTTYNTYAAHRIDIPNPLATTQRIHVRFNAPPVIKPVAGTNSFTAALSFEVVA